MPRKLMNRVALWSTVVVAITIGVAVGSLLSTARFFEISDRIDHSHEIVLCLKDLINLVKDAESGQRGYLLTGGIGKYLGSYDENRARTFKKLETVAWLTRKDEPDRRQVAQTLKLLISKKFAFQDETIRLSQAGNAKAALDLILTDQGFRIMAEIDQVIARADSSERRILANIASKTRILRNVKVALSLVCASLTIAILIAVYHFVGREMEERKRVELELSRTSELAEAANRAKGNFMANVSHEIRTPMNAILGMTELTLESDLAPNQRENLEIVKSATDSLLSIINDVLDFSKMEAGKVALEQREFALRDELGKAMDLLGLRAAEKGLEFACRIDSGVPDRLVGDASRLRQILLNLVGNAVKFTEKGEVVVEVESNARSGGHVELHFRVTDTGIGVPAEKCEMIFAPFTQADGSTTRPYEGTGLGLAISTQLVSLMGGRIWLESEPGLGSTFHFTAILAASKADFPSGSACLTQLKGLRVLAVDDNAMNRRVMEEMLIAWKMEPTLASGGREAIEELKRARDSGMPYSLVLLDALMPDMDGFSVAGEIKREKSLQANVILMLTSSDRQGFAERASQAGIAACLNKPIHQNKLLESILTVLSQSPRTMAPARSKRSSRNPARTLRILMAEDNPYNQRVAVLMLAKSGHAVTIAVNGRQAVDSLQDGNFDLVLMDLQMPVMDGLKATLEIRASEAGTSRHIPIIALTGHAMKEDEERCMAVGMDGYVTKPIQEEKLLDAIDRCHLPQRPPIGPRADRAEKFEPTRVVDLESALERVDGDRAFLKQMVTLFLAESPALMVQIHGALDRGDAASLIAPAHSLKNWAGNFAAESAFDALARLEAMGRSGSMTEARYAGPELVGKIEQLTIALGRFDP